MIRKFLKLSRVNSFFLISCVFVLFQQFNFSIASACPEANVTDAWFIGILELENTVLPEKIEIVPSYDFSRGGYEFFSFFIFNETNDPIHIFSLDYLDTLIEAQNNNLLSDQIDYFLANEMGIEIKSKQNTPEFHLTGIMLKSLDPKIMELNQFDYYLPDNLEIPAPQNSSFIVVSDGEIFTIKYQLSYEINEDFNGYVIICDMDGSSEFESDSAAVSPTTNTKIPPIYFILAGGLILLICGVAGVLVFNRKSS